MSGYTAGSAFTETPQTMATPFDPSQSVAFDLNRGQIAVKGSGERLLVPADALLSLCLSVGSEELSDFGRRLGTEAGRRVAERLGEIEAATVETIVDHLGGDLALLGLGSLELERWGKALVFVIEDSPFGAQGDPVLAAVLSGALQRAFGRNAGVIRIDRDDQRARFLVTSPGGAERVRAWLSEGTTWGDALTRLDRTRGDS